MVVADLKPIQEILEMIQDHEKVLVAGCRGCVAVCNTGGEKEVGNLAALLRVACQEKGWSKTIGEFTLERQCDPEFLEEVAGAVGEFDAILSIACSVGPQFLSERFTGHRVYPGVNTTFIGGAKEHGVWVERCQACGNCAIHKFGGLCPIARCSKSLMNGPCGGSANGVCEVDPDIPCVWDQIVKKMTADGRVEELYGVKPLKNWSTSRDGGPRKRIREDMRK